MKKLLYIFAAAAALSAVSCVKENFDGAQEGATTFYGKALDVKTQVLDGHTVWAANDNIKVFYNNANVVAELKMGENTSSATFEASVGAATDYYAVYPASETASMTDGTMTVTLPATQNGLFGAGHIAVAKAADKTFTFTNVNAFLKMTFASAQYTRIVVESVAGEALAGDLSITFAGGVPAVAATYANTSSSVEVTSETPFAAGDIYISVLPGVTHTQGLLVTCYNGEQLKGTYYVDKSVATEASVTLTFDVFEPNGNYYVTAEGAGNQNGLSLTNAMSVAKAVELIRKSATDQAALKAIDGAVFNFAAGEYVLADEALALSYDAAEPVKLTFKGEEGTVFSGNETHSIMTISGADVSMEGITITKSVVTETKTGAIKVSGENSKLTLSKCALFANTVNGEQIFCAGVAATEGAELVVTECEVIDNSAYSASAFYIDGADVNVTATSFEGNWTDDDAGVMLLEGTQQSSFADCEFTSNAAYKHGMIKHASGKTTFANCTFTKNKVYKDCDGGVFTLLADAEGELVLNGGEISENFAGWGAGVYQETGNSVLTVSDIVFKNNETVGSGVIWSGGSSSMTKCTFDANTAGGTTKTDGLALTAATGADMQLYGCTVMNHSSSNSSTAIVVRDGATLKIAQASDQTKSVIKNNTAAWGGAMALTGAGKAIISDTEFLENHAKGAGVFRIVEKSSVSLTDCVFEGNYTTGGNGGAIAHESSGTVTCNRCHFEGNYAAHRGGAVCVDGSSHVNIGYSTFIGNHSDNNGGAICVIGAPRLDLFRSSFIGNYGESGGVIYTGGSSGSGYPDLFIDECSFDANYITARYGTTMNIDGINRFCMHNSSIRGSYNTKNQSGDKASWLAIDISYDGCNSSSISNCSIIGNTQYSSDGSSFTTIDGAGLIALWGDKHYFTNNIIVPESDAVVSILGGTCDLAYNHYNTLSGVTSTDNGGNVSGLTAGDIDALTWSNDDSDSYYWKWDGTINGSAPSFTNQLNVYNRVNGVCLDFVNWSGSDFYKDQRNAARGDGDWWPGSYQKD